MPKQWPTSKAYRACRRFYFYFPSSCIGLSSDKSGRKQLQSSSPVTHGEQTLLIWVLAGVCHALSSIPVKSGTASSEKRRLPVSTPASHHWQPRIGHKYATPIMVTPAPPLPLPRRSPRKPRGGCCSTQ